MNKGVCRIQKRTYQGLLAPAEEFEFDFIDTAGEEIYVGFRKSELATLFLKNLITPVTFCKGLF